MDFSLHRCGLGVVRGDEGMSVCRPEESCTDGSGPPGVAVGGSPCAGTLESGRGNLLRSCSCCSKSLYNFRPLMPLMVCQGTPAYPLASSLLVNFILAGIDNSWTAKVLTSSVVQSPAGGRRKAGVLVVKGIDMSALLESRENSGCSFSSV